MTAVRPPTISSSPYGPWLRNDLDLWVANFEKPSPLLVYIHGGGFMWNSKEALCNENWQALLSTALERGISVASINYRLAQQAPAPAAFHDAARAIQWLRFNAQRWWIDPDRIAAAGPSAGAGLAEYLGFHPDLAEPDSGDPVARQSSRVQCVLAFAAQCSYDPRFIRSLIPGPAYRQNAMQMLFRARPEEYDDPRLAEAFREASPIEFVSADAPPVFLAFPQPNVPLSEDLPPGAAIHHPRFGEVLKERLDAFGVPCTLRYREDMPAELEGPALLAQFSREAVEFMARHLGIP